MGDQASPPNVFVNGPDPGDLGGGEEVEAVLTNPGNRPRHILLRPRWSVWIDGHY